MATQRRFERANQGTLFMDEIGDLPLVPRPELRRVIQERQFELLGVAATIHTDLRVVCDRYRISFRWLNPKTIGLGFKDGDLWSTHRTLPAKFAFALWLIFFAEGKVLNE